MKGRKEGWLYYLEIIIRVFVLYITVKIRVFVRCVALHQDEFITVL